MEALARYDQIADFYDATTGDVVTDGATAGLLDLLGDISGKRFLDLGCGSGRIARALARRGAGVTGIDISTALLAKARAAEYANPLFISYLQGNVTSPSALDGEFFDGITCNHALADIDDLDGALATVERLLQVDGLFAFSILHPCFPGWDQDAPSSWPPGKGYYQEGWWLADNPGFRGKVGANHRMLSTYLNALTHHHLGIESVVEAPPPAEWTTRAPAKDPVPVFLAIRCRKAALVGALCPASSAAPESGVSQTSPPHVHPPRGKEL